MFYQERSARDASIFLFLPDNLHKSGGKYLKIRINVKFHVKIFAQMKVCLYLCIDKTLKQINTIYENNFLFYPFVGCNRCNYVVRFEFVRSMRRNSGGCRSVFVYEGRTMRKG